MTNANKVIEQLMHSLSKMMEKARSALQKGLNNVKSK